MLTDQGVESRISHHMTSVSKHCSSEGREKEEMLTANISRLSNQQIFGQS